MDSEHISRLDEVKALMKTHGITIDQLVPKRGAPKGIKIAIKYKDQSGNTWSGRGLIPVWMRQALATGATKDSFRI